MEVKYNGFTEWMDLIPYQCTKLIKPHSHGYWVLCLRGVIMGHWGFCDLLTHVRPGCCNHAIATFASYKNVLPIWSETQHTSNTVSNSEITSPDWARGFVTNSEPNRIDANLTLIGPNRTDCRSLSSVSVWWKFPEYPNGFVHENFLFCNSWGRFYWNVWISLEGG